MTAHYEDGPVTVWHGDCIDVMREMPDQSVDAIVTDPPYGLEFMGREWDSFRSDDRDVRGYNGRATGAAGEARALTGDDVSEHPGRRNRAVAYGGGNRATTSRCEACGKRDQFRKPHGCAEGTNWRTEIVDPYAAPPSMLAFQNWCREWAAEAYRLLKPGGHLLAFGGTRTFHRLTSGIEDAGFEIRDSIAWLYGSGFPKSLDVGKAIDKRPGVSSHPDFAADLSAARHRAGLTRADVSERVVGSRTGACWNWEHHQFPEAKWWPALRDLLDMDGDKWDAVIAQADRITTGKHTTGLATGAAGVGGFGDGKERRDAPATADAARWNGWGTALKPSHEPVVVARKPLQPRGSLAEIGSHLDRLGNEWQAQAAAQPTRTGAADGSPAPTGTSPSESMATTGSSIVSSWSGYWAELCEAPSTSTTATTDETTTALRTLSSSIALLTAANMLQPDPTNGPGLSSTASAVDALFVSAVYASRATRALSATATAIERTPPSRPDAAGSAFEPIVVARKPLAGTVAANVLAYGTGALNIDGSRIGTAPITSSGSTGMDARRFQHGTRPTNYGGGTGEPSTHAGRWPANVVLDASQAVALNQQSGAAGGGFGVRGRGGSVYANGAGFANSLTETGQTVGYGDSGGASRFFKTVDTVTPRFMYTAKAGSDERPGVDGVSHPTVKPVDLMRWLVRLVTPPDGTVLEPFAGSGTTVEACVLEGFHCIAIEREADYLPLILKRIRKPHAVGLDFGEWEA